MVHGVKVQGVMVHGVMVNGVMEHVCYGVCVLWCSMLWCMVHGDIAIHLFLKEMDIMTPPCPFWCICPQVCTALIQRTRWRASCLANWLMEGIMNGFSMHMSSNSYSFDSKNAMEGIMIGYSMPS